MYLIIDIGNTYSKVAVFLRNEILEIKRVIISEVYNLVQYLKTKYTSITHTLISSVKEIDSIFPKHFLDSVIQLTSKTGVPFKNNYKTPKTLGADRKALVGAAFYEFPDTNVLIIDSGSCITYDFITNTGEYLGGGIAPGLQMRLKSLNNYTDKLPLLKVSNLTTTQIPLIGSSTEAAIYSGSLQGAIFEIEGMITSFKREYPTTKVILTGGDAIFLSKQLKSDIFVEPNFLLLGLNHLLNYTLQK